MKRSLRVYPQKTPLRGTVTVPGDKSISHRAVMLGALATGRSHVRRWLPAGDPVATLEIFRQLGVNIDVTERSPTAWDLVIDGVGLHGLQRSDAPLNAKNAGTCLRLLAGIMAGQRFDSVLDGSEQLRKRPMKRIVDPLRLMGAAIESREGKAPLTIQPASLKGTTYEMPVASAQVKSCVLLAGIYAEGETVVVEPGAARDHTERMLRGMGANVTQEGNRVSIRPVEQLKPLDMTVPADISSAAFPLVAGAIVPHSEVTIANCGLNGTRTGIIDILQQLGADIAVKNVVEAGGEPTGDVTASFSEMHGASIAGDVVVRGIDEFPILTVALTQAAGSSSVGDAAELRVKEVDRIGVLAGELARMGAVISQRPDGFTLEGPLRLNGATVDSHDDHRLGMALAIAALIANSPTVIDDAGCIADSFPGFVEVMRSLGAHMEWVK